MAPPEYPISIIVLAAGQSTRMGAQNKLLLPFAGKPLLQVVLDMLAPMPVLEKLVVVNPQEKDIRTLIDAQKFRLVLNPDFTEGISASIKYGVWASSDATLGYLFYLADMPLIKPHTLLTLLQKFDSAHPRNIMIPVFKGKRGNPVLIGRAYREKLLQLKGDVGARKLISEIDTSHIIEVPVKDEGILLDVDNREAYYDLIGKGQ